MPEKSLKNSLALSAVLLRDNGGGVREKEFRTSNTLTVISHKL